MTDIRLNLSIVGGLATRPDKTTDYCVRDAIDGNSGRPFLTISLMVVETDG